MDRGAWWAAAHRVTKELDLVTKQQHTRHCILTSGWMVRSRSLCFNKPLVDTWSIPKSKKNCLSHLFSTLARHYYIITMPGFYLAPSQFYWNWTEKQSDIGISWSCLDFQMCNQGWEPFLDHIFISRWHKTRVSAICICQCVDREGKEMDEKSSIWKEISFADLVWSQSQLTLQTVGHVSNEGLDSKDLGMSQLEKVEIWAKEQIL